MWLQEATVFIETAFVASEESFAISHWNSTIVANSSITINKDITNILQASHSHPHTVHL